MRTIGSKIACSSALKMMALFGSLVSSVVVLLTTLADTCSFILEPSVCTQEKTILSEACGMLVGKMARTVSSSTLNLATSLSCGVKQCRRMQPGTSRRDSGKPGDHR